MCDGGITRPGPALRERGRLRFTTGSGLLVAALLIAGCQAPDPDRDATGESATPVPSTPAVVDGAPRDPGSRAEAPTEPPPPVDAAAGSGPIPASTPLTSDGWGPLRIGMTRAQVVAAAGEDANPDAVGGPDPDSCDEFRPSRAPAGLLVMIESGRLTRISVGSSSEVASDRGIAIGDDATAVRRAYGEAVQSSPHKYVAAPAAYLTIWSLEPPSPNARGLQYEVGQDGRVSRIHAGGPSIQYVEGCL